MEPLTTDTAAIARVQEICDDFLASKGAVRVLDAGCGSHSYVDIGAGAHVTGIDISEAQVATNERLDASIVADLQTYKIPVESFEIVVCWEVLEHLEEPVPVIERLARAVVRDGLLIIGAPNPRSLKGLVTRFTPHSFHVWMYRKFFNPDAKAEPGKGPFPTFMRAEGRHQHVERVAQANGLSPMFLAVVESPMQIAVRERLRIPRPVWRAVCLLTRLFSGGSVEPEATDYMLVLHRTA